MYYYFKGQISLIKKDYVVIEVNNIGYQVYVSNVDNFILGEYRTIYLYNVVREDEQYLAGFSSLEEKEAFESLISVKGIGPRTALGILSGTTVNDLYNAIASNNVTYLKKLPGIGSKAAAQIILDLKGQLALAGVENTKANINQYQEVRDALKSLGFKVKEIDETLSTISIPNGTNEEILRAALRKMNKK
ncbi:MAG: Holliday junction branch migration protein RuvA [Bacillales bacterium]|nr:Holliday junction branch migration protein RuvA [Bacillales bacterium]MDY6003604.1 Holliday junction branch migration protein RuvA [Bacilli bacterium]